MFFSGYSQFLQSESQVIDYASSNRKESFLESGNFITTPMLQSQHDIGYSQFTEVISKRLLSQPYPINFQNHNPFCPICLKFVENRNQFLTCFINSERNYLIHQECFLKDKAYGLRNVGQILQNKFSIQENTKESARRFDQGFDNRFFFVQLTISHPINDKNFFKLNRKVSLIRNYFMIPIDQKQYDSFTPNLLMIPLTDFHLTINIQEVSQKDNRCKFTRYISMRSFKDRKKMSVKVEGLELEAEITQNKQDKLKLVNSMNYKYRYPLQLPLPMLRIWGFKIALPQQFEEQEEQEYIVGSSSTIVQELLAEKDTHSLSTIRTSQPTPPRHNFSFTDSNSSQEGPAVENQKIDLQKMIANDTLVAYVKNNTQSRQFQIFLDQCGPTQIATIISHITPCLSELIMHEYGNYMVQKLFTVCSAYQRLQILQIILPNLGQLVKNKQGTHTIQAFVGFFTMQQEFQLMAIRLRQDYYELCRHSNATHFIQKIIKIFPLQYSMAFFHYTVQNLIAFALDKNAMCVIKHMMRRLRQLQGKAIEHDQAIDALRRQLITNVTFSVDQLIMDSYGNYVIQFCYQLFDIQKCSGITERILSRFPYYATGKYSSNVLLKCISLYWQGKSFYFSLKKLSNSQIVQIFRNKDGNKVLLEIMEKHEGSELWDRLFSILIQVEPTRFYHDRWGVCLGSRSGQVGTRLAGFPEARRKNDHRR